MRSSIFLSEYYNWKIVTNLWSISDCVDYVPEVWAGITACKKGKRLVSDRISIKEKFFYSIKFSTDRGYATSLGMNIYLWKEDIEDGASVMTVEYRPVEYGKDYDVVNNPDIFELYIDGKEVKE